MAFVSVAGVDIKKADLFSQLFAIFLEKIWCPARDLNPHACALDPKSSVSANFTSGAHLKFEKQ